MRKNQEELDEETTGARPEPETDVEAAEDSGISEAEAGEFGTAKLEAGLEEMEGKYLRTRAEVVNMANQGKNEREQLRRYRSQGLVKKLLPSVDNLERALATEVSDDQRTDLRKSVEMALESLRNALGEEGIEKIPARREAFNPNLHQAARTVPATGDTPADTIIEVLQGGYKLHDRMLRPAMVVVAQ